MMIIRYESPNSKRKRRISMPAPRKALGSSQVAKGASISLLLNSQNPSAEGGPRQTEGDQDEARAKGSKGALCCERAPSARGGCCRIVSALRDGALCNFWKLRLIVSSLRDCCGIVCHDCCGIVAFALELYLCFAMELLVRAFL